MSTRRPASADRTARRQFQATGQPVSRTQASDAMTSRLPRYCNASIAARCKNQRILMQFSRIDLEMAGTCDRMNFTHLT